MALEIPNQPQGPFEGPEKLLEIWFKPSADQVPDATQPDPAGRTGLRKIGRKTWEEMLEIVKCQVLSVVRGDEMDAYLLSESSLFVAPHRLILKTCGTTLNLLGLPRILEIAATQANMPSVHRCFYSRKSFMFPERQLGPHRGWTQEVEFLDNIFTNGAAYTVGKVNGDHWLLYLTDPGDGNYPRSAPNSPVDPTTFEYMPDYTIEILMSDLSSTARESFLSLPVTADPRAHGTTVSRTMGISDIYPPNITTLDAYSFSPCGYSANALVKWGDEKLMSICDNDAVNKDIYDSKEGYFTIHVTPEEGWSYASFECNVPSHTSGKSRTVPDLKTLVQRVVRIFQPDRLSLTLFISSRANESDQGDRVEAAQKAFKAALTEPGITDQKSCPDRHSPTQVGEKRVYRRTDKINYELGGYDLAFASFALDT